MPGEESWLVDVVRQGELYELEGLEEWWVPLLTRATAILMSFALTILLLVNSQYLMVVLLG